jgi:hemoglobin/transferrin/lactoferrin receptor protein
LAAAPGAAAPGAAAAGQAAVEGTAIEEIVVVASRHPQPVADVTASVSVVDRDALAARIARDIADVVEALPGVSAAGGDTRFAADGPRIRGLGGNRVAVKADGAPLPAGFAVGAFSAAGRDFITPATLERVEVLKGPASSLHGSDALGGVVALTSLDPAEIVAGSGRDWQAGAGVDYHGADAGRTLSLHAAWSDANGGVLVHAGRRHAAEVDNAAGGIRDDRDLERDVRFAKVTHSWPGTGAQDTRLELVHERFEEAVQADLRTVLGYGRRFATTTSLRADDTRRGRRLVGSLEFPAPFVDAAVLRAWHVHAGTDQFTFESRAGSAPSSISRRFRYAHEGAGAELDARRTLSVLGVDHGVGFGLQYTSADIADRRDGEQVVLATGARSNVVLGERFPVRDFPLTETRSLGAYVFDEVAVLPRLVLIPGARIDRFVVDARNDPVYAEDNPRAAPVDVDVSHVSPRLAARLRVDDSWTLHVQVASGFRAPPFDDVNIGLDLPALGVRAIPNPDLRPERMRAYEVGARCRSPLPGLDCELALFTARSRDFIESRVNLGPDTDGTLVFQSRNVRRTRIDGVEAGLRQDLGAVAGVLDGWYLSASAVAVRGEDRGSGEPLNTIDPPEARLRVDYHPPGSRLRLALTAIAVRGVRLDGSRLDLFEAPGFVRLDAEGSWVLGRFVTVRARIENVTDRTYWRHARVGERPADDPMLPALSAPGRALALAAVVNL